MTGTSPLVHIQAITMYSQPSMEDIYDPEYIQRLFNRMSYSYERMNFITSFGFSVLWRRQFIEKVESNSNEITIIDLLSGLGENWSILTKQFPNAQFTALDFSEEMYNASQQKNSQKFGNRFRVVHQDILQNTLPSNEYDIVTCAFGLKTFNEKQLHNLAMTINRILKPDGKFIFIEISKPSNKTLLFFYKLYLSKIIPMLGKLFLGNPSDYRMLWEYTDRFGNSEHVREIFEQHALTVTFDSYFYGCATGISGHKKNTT